MARENSKARQPWNIARLPVFVVVAIGSIAWSQAFPGDFAAVVGASLVPALLGWILVQKVAQAPRAIIRGVGIEFLIVGMMAFGSVHDRLVSQSLNLEAADTATFSGKVGILLALGITALIGSLFGEKAEKN